MVGLVDHEYMVPVGLKFYPKKLRNFYKILAGWVRC